MDGIAAHGITERLRQQQPQCLRRRQQRLQQWRRSRSSGCDNILNDGGRAAAAAVAGGDTSPNGPRRSRNRRAATTVPMTAAMAVGERTLTLCVFTIELSDLRLEMYCVVCRGPIRLNQDPIYPNLPGNLPPIYPLPGKTTSLHTAYPHCNNQTDKSIYIAFLCFCPQRI